MLQNVCVLRKRERIEPQQRHLPRIRAVHRYIFATAEDVLVFALGWLDNEESHTMVVYLAKQFINRIALARTGGTCDKSVHGQALQVELHTISALATHIKYMTQIDVSVFTPPSADRYFFAEAGVIHNRQTAH